ncbi:MAG: hypothetical protein JJT88_02710 [Gammaproteobacteria bacterium]|nr:hypothetical protein [Gammaproteobacteria bacterium]
MTEEEDKPTPTGDDERRAGAGRRREPRFDWETGDPIKDRRLQDDGKEGEAEDEEG